MWKFKSACLTSQWIQEESTKEIRKSLEINENKNTIYQSSWDSVRQGHTGEEAMWGHVEAERGAPGAPPTKLQEAGKCPPLDPLERSAHSAPRHFRPWASRLWENKFLWFGNTQFVIICPSRSHVKPLHDKWSASVNGLGLLIHLPVITWAFFLLFTLSKLSQFSHYWPMAQT